MNKKEFILSVANRCGMKKKDVENVINSAFAVVGETLATGENVRLTGFGTFNVRKSKPRIGRNPQTGERITIKPRMVPFLRCGKGLKEVVQPKPAARGKKRTKK